MSSALQTLAQSSPSIQAILSDLPWAQNGILLQAAVHLLVTHHVQNRIHKDRIQSDTCMENAFGGIIPAAYYIFERPNSNPPSLRVSGHLITIPVDQMQQQHSIPISTYGILRESWPHFDSARFDPKFIDYIVAANVYRYDRICEDPYLEEITHAMAEDGEMIERTLPELARLLKSKSVRAALHQEYALLQERIASSHQREVSGATE